MNMHQLAKFAALAVAVGAVAGCGKNDGAPAYANVSGTVTYNGQPLPKGEITFSTDGRPPTVMDIADGKFVGSNRVSVSAFRKATKERKVPETAQKQIAAYQQMYKSPGGSLPDAADPSLEDYIPEDWGRESKQIRVVEPGSGNNFQFDIKGK